MSSKTLRCLAAIALVAGCGDDKPAKGTGSAGSSTVTTTDPAVRCMQLAKACGEQEKHITKILDGCNEASVTYDASCSAKLLAAFDCYEKELCGKGDKVWAFTDLTVLVERHGKCVTEAAAARSCTGKK